MKILVLNCGSSSLKGKLLEMETSDVLAKGQADRIGLSDALFRHEVKGREPVLNKTPLFNHHEAVHALLTHLVGSKRGILTDMNEIGGVGHRVVNGIEHFLTSVVVDAIVRGILETTKKLAPTNEEKMIADESWAVLQKR